MERISKNIKIISLSVFIIINIFIFYAIFQYHNNFLKVTFLNVGQGDAIFIESPTGNQILIDGGPNKKILEALGGAMPFYDRSIDAVLATHPDLDHIGGLPEVLNSYKVKEYFDNGVKSETDASKELAKDISDKKITHSLLKRGELMDLGGGVFIEILFPFDVPDPKSKDTNEYSIVAKVYYGNTSFLLTGDAPIATEKLLVAYDGKRLASDVLKVAHHGSKNSLSDAFLSAVSPKFSVISVGKDNRYGHPNQEVLDFLGKINTKILETFISGNICFYSDGTSITEE